MVGQKQFIGQEPIIAYLATEIQYAKRNNVPLDHILLSGPAGMGKSTLAKLIAVELGYELCSYVADATWTARKVVTELMKLDVTGYSKDGYRGPSGKRYLIFMDEIHLLTSHEPWYSVLQDGEVYYNGAVSWLPDITFIGATTIPVLPKPFMDRIPNHLRFSPYSVGELTEIIETTYPFIPVPDQVAIATRSRQTARIALHYAKAYIKHGGLGFFDKIGVDERGLTALDRSYLDALRGYGRPLSLKSLSAILSEDQRSLEAIVEPFLKSLNLIVVTPQGRILNETDQVSRYGRGHKGADILDSILADTGLFDVH